MIYPDIKKQVLEIYEAEFLNLNNLKLGDEVSVEFSFTKLHTAYKSRKMERFNKTVIGNGILKKDERGLYVESNLKYSFHYLTSNGLTGHQRKEWYKQEMKTSIFRIKGNLNF